MEASSMTVPDTTLAWLAALIDGEGSVLCTKHQTRASRLRAEGRPPFYSWRLSVSVCNTDYRLMEALLGKTGAGVVYKHTRQPKENHKKTGYTWRLNTTELRVWLPLIRPWLVLKGEQVDCQLEMLSMRRVGVQYTPEELARVNALAASISELNRKGRHHG